ncbi:MAG: Ku protein [Fulvimarina manganoxydans]|uniref:non-homologous end joining protein Ku n=1 Tax=Fulvimarina manganoxydans TaxID=937218 RepID=UPI0023524A50|nr:Ku protein [Fulvimarina manganoxydans]MCK5930931.1 Ku protein [Fulvimarina manganoxydans]
MAPRPVWKGQIRLSLVSIPVEIFSATTSGASVSFRQIHRESGKRVRNQKIVPGIGPVDGDEIVKGYETSKGEYVLLSDEEIDDIKLETKKTFELVQFVDSHSIPPLYFDKPYYVVPQDDLSEDAFRVVRDALRSAKKTGLGQLTLRGKEYLCALRPCGNGLLLETLHYEEEIRKSKTIFEDISDDPPEEDLLDVATALIEKKSGPFDAGAYTNHYTDALKTLIAAKRKSGGKAVETEDDDDEAEAKGGKGRGASDLMASLKKSLEGDGGSGTRERKSQSSSSKRGSASRSTSKARGRSKSTKKKSA